jgi:hypothetical protein
MFNCGVFAARAASPVWRLWGGAMAEASGPMRDDPRLYFSDQTPFHHLVASGRLTIHPLRAVNNWLVHAALPGVDLVRKQLVTPNYPHEPINIVHLTGVTKDDRYALAGVGSISFRYSAVRALFSGERER